MFLQQLSRVCVYNDPFGKWTWKTISLWAQLCLHLRQVFFCHYENIKHHNYQVHLETMLLICSFAFLYLAGALLDDIEYYLYKPIIDFAQESVNLDSGTLVDSSLRIHPHAVFNAFDTGNKGRCLPLNKGSGDISSVYLQLLQLFLTLCPTISINRNHSLIK